MKEIPLAHSINNGSEDGSKTRSGPRRKTPPGLFVIMQSGNTVLNHDGRIITWPYFLSTLPKSTRLRLAGKSTASSRQVKSIIRDAGISLITLPSTAIEVPCQGPNQNSELAAEIHRLVQLSLKASSARTKPRKVKKLFRSAGTSTELSESMVVRTLSESGLWEKSEKALRSRYSTEIEQSKTRTT